MSWVTDELVFKIRDDGDDFPDVYQVILERDGASYSTVVLSRTHKWRKTHTEVEEETKIVLTWRAKHLQKLIDALVYMQAKSND